ncbi:PAS domain S-box protein [Mesorhizobium sp. M1C.F.Ca.ET.193.01.1.1]|uniref:PAS domain S-box protein n=2 Tax=Mesorhizobium TaxID=68287 RepID=UPI000FD54232|nr:MULTISPECIES: PAS domain S-box protein [unclassified Mesorhizobium]TGS93427.1 PAS domain S-box protein [bacterium M00.F.Ca.ET.177.01.1.1]RWA62385.1 MAG: PAS domain S-box protein [Mesorhizobium sp.]RWB94668.1 MAG: PAS domain S-box protein [Mesorhizobium sp.]RWG78382.1 MAG: PAS domain S-box protein [Mesorhizobium sp.]RWG83368.1 MAG: PAS domain S-box protein [Mesorhizobium sp.]
MQHRAMSDAAMGRGQREQADGDIVREQAVLFRLTDRLYRANGLGEIYDAALDAICDALGSSRASILRFDKDGVMSFVAWRSLSEKYRKAVNGHTPWTSNERDAKPIFVENIRLSGESRQLIDTVLGEGIEALAFIPIVSSRELIGKFMVYYPAPHRFADRERELALTIARQLGFAIERERAETTAARLSALVESSDDAIIATDMDGSITDWNNGAERLYGYSRNEIIGRPLTLLIPPDRQKEDREMLARIRNGEHVEHFETVRLRKDGSIVPISLTVSPIADASGAIVGVSKIARGISERLRAQEQRELLLREMDHRVKNLFAITSSIIKLSAPAAETPAELASIVSDRLGALARAHALTMLTSIRSPAQDATSLHGLIAAILAPYRHVTDELPHFAIRGIDIPVPAALITPLSLLLHEFATNAAKHGSLSAATGSIEIACSNRDGKVTVHWREVGGPPPVATEDEGFGSRLIRAAASELGGIVRNWDPAGVVLELTINIERFSA